MQPQPIMTALNAHSNQDDIILTMCRPDDSGRKPPQEMRSSSMGTSVSKDQQAKEQRAHEPTAREFMPATWKCVLAAATLPPLTMAFGSWFPFVIPYTHASLYYEATDYVYDAEHTRFDNTALTYGTDYLLFVWMLVGCIDMYRISQHISRIALTAEGRAKGRNWMHLKDAALITSGMLACYACSVLFGGLSHHFFISLEMMNTVAFRIMWSITVGLVTAAAGFIGAIGSHFALYFTSKVDDAMPIMPMWFWAYFGFYLTMVCWAGGMSFYRPAVDIFIAGTAQFIPTMYIVGVVLTRRYGNDKSRNTINMSNATTSTKEGKEPDSGDETSTVNSDDNRSESDRNNGKTGRKGKTSAAVDSRQPLLPDRGEAPPVKTAYVKVSTRVWLTIAFFLNAPLLPVYPELLWSGLELGVVNTILHTNLATAWGLQYLSIKWICESQLADVASGK
jgi:hypothetical protein